MPEHSDADKRPTNRDGAGYRMKISRMTVDKLGIKLYDKVANVLAELIANSYDADAHEVTVSIPLNKWLATKKGRKIEDRGYRVTIEDDGHGMQKDLVNDTYLDVGSDPRTDKKNRGPVTPGGRHIMGRKGIGKLAPFGICKVIEIWSAGGKKTAKGYEVANFILNYDDIHVESDEPYPPKAGKDDGKYSKKKGTRITLTNFLFRKTPNSPTLQRQLARIFGMPLPDFRIVVKDALSKKTRFVVGELELEIEPGTKISVDDRPVPAPGYGNLPVKGFVAYSKKPYKNEEIAGVRIYARGKLVTSTRDFGLEAGFHGEYNIRSYLTGWVQADWLDDDNDDDLIHTGRQEILWDSDKGTALRKWGQELLRELGNKALAPTRERAAKTFLELSNIAAKAEERYGKTVVAEAAVKLAKSFGSMLDRESLGDPGYVESVADIVLAVAPHTTLVDKLVEISKTAESTPVSVLISLFNDANLAEEASMGQIAKERINSITKLQEMIRAGREVNELSLQELLERVPWLIEPKWTILQANQTFENLRTAYVTWYKSTHGGKEVVASAIGSPTKRPDFIMLPIAGKVELVEIKKPEHKLEDAELDRIIEYKDTMIEFLEKNPDFKREFGGVHVTLICDELSLSRTAREAYNGLRQKGDLEKKTWWEVIQGTTKAHQDFLTRWDQIHGPPPSKQKD